MFTGSRSCSDFQWQEALCATSDGVVFVCLCTVLGHPYPNKRYAVKLALPMPGARNRYVHMLQLLISYASLFFVFRRFRHPVAFHVCGFQGDGDATSIFLYLSVLIPLWLCPCMVFSAQICK